MKTLTVGEFKSGFSQVLKDVGHGEEIIVSYGKSKKKVAVVIPFEKYEKKPKRQLGLLEGKAFCIIKKNFKITDEEFLKL